MSSINVSKAVKKNPSVGLKSAAPDNSIWMNVRRTPKMKPDPVVWENIEDISDDETDTPQKAGKRLSTMKAVRDQIQRRAYKKQLIGLQNAGLFLNWSKPLPSSHWDSLQYADTHNREAYPYFQKYE